MAQTTSELNKIAHQIQQINPVLRGHIQIPRQEVGYREFLSLTNANIIKQCERNEHGIHISLVGKT